MSYTSQQGLIDRFGQRELIQLTDRTNTPATTIDTDVVDQALADADALIDGYVGKVYALPLVTVPPILSKLAADIARYFLHGDRAGKDHPVTTAYNDAVKWLKDVAKGLVKLDDGAGDEPGLEGGGQVRVSRPDRVMSRDKLSGYS